MWIKSRLIDPKPGQEIRYANRIFSIHFIIADKVFVIEGPSNLFSVPKKNDFFRLSSWTDIPTHGSVIEVKVDNNYCSRYQILE